MIPVRVPIAKDLSLEFLRHSGQSWLCFRVYRNGCGPLSSVTSRVLRHLAARYFVGGIGLLFSAFLHAVSHALAVPPRGRRFSILLQISRCLFLHEAQNRNHYVLEWKRSKFKIKRSKYKTAAFFDEDLNKVEFSIRKILHNSL